MTERERWIVYPLLFLALGVALRDKLVERTTTRTVRCEELIVEEEATANEPGRLIAKIGRVEPNANSPSIPIFYMRGQAKIDGILNVSGIVNADQYAYQGTPFNFFIQPLQGLPIPHVGPPMQPGPNQPPGTPPSQSNPSPSGKSGRPTGAATTPGK